MREKVLWTHFDKKKKKCDKKTVGQQENCDVQLFLRKQIL